MAVDDWKNLGLSHDSFKPEYPPSRDDDIEAGSNAQPKSQPQQGRPAFVAGVKTARARQKQTEGKV